MPSNSISLKVYILSHFTFLFSLRFPVPTTIPFSSPLQFHCMAVIHRRKSRMFFEKRTEGRSIWKTQFCSYLQYGISNCFPTIFYKKTTVLYRFPTASANCSRACLIITRGLATFKRMNPSPPGPNISPSFSAR